MNQYGTTSLSSSASSVSDGSSGIQADIHSEGSSSSQHDVWLDSIANRCESEGMPVRDLVLVFDLLGVLPQPKEPKVVPVPTTCRVAQLRKSFHKNDKKNLGTKAKREPARQKPLNFISDREQRLAACARIDMESFNVMTYSEVIEVSKQFIEHECAASTGQEELYPIHSSEVAPMKVEKKKKTFMRKVLRILGTPFRSSVQEGIIIN